MSEQQATTAGWTPGMWAIAIVAWLWVGVPFAWGLYELIIKIPALFG
ncbi:MFS transporter small subunit [Pseudonocardia endophytica]|uniref:Oxalate:formate antiporter n=1 Tax=Pseudonocardia endophytica TaxID=401976 RepID=A0A4R1HMY3_PSEEN|nr:hypothetical protein [Pseudonocardia endophytica]TCK21029.1 hypothetical protein EV378_5003 [Pseudonocardia endophytica]